IIIRLTPTSPLFPYTTLFRSRYALLTVHYFKDVILSGTHRRLFTCVMANNRRHEMVSISRHVGKCPNVAEQILALLHLPTIKPLDRKSTRLNSSHLVISYAVF